MKRNRINFDPGSESGGGDPFAGLAEALSTGEIAIEQGGQLNESEQQHGTGIEQNKPAPKPKPVSVPEKKVAPEAGQENQAGAEEEVEEEGGEPGTEKAGEKKKTEEGAQGAEGQEEEEILGEIKTVGSEEGDSNGGDVVEYFPGMPKLKDPTSFEEFAENAKKYSDDRFREGLEKGKSESTVGDLSKHSPESRELIKALDGGKKYEEILNPLMEFDAVLRQPDKEIVEGYLSQVKKWDKEMIDDQMAVLEENGQLAVEAKKVRKLLEVQRDNTVKSIIQQGAKAWEDEQKVLENKRKEEDKKVQ